METRFPGFFLPARAREKRGSNRHDASRVTALIRGGKVDAGPEAGSIVSSRFETLFLESLPERLL
jgi:hypothetical protein